MAEGISKYSYQENFSVGYQEIFGNFATANAIAPYNPNYNFQALPLGGSIYNFQRLNQNLVFYFDVNLNPPNPNIKTLSIKYINSCLTTAGGYLFQLSCPQLFRTPVQFIDSSSTFGVHTEYLNQQLPTNKARFTLTMLSGSKPNTLNTGNNSPNYNNIPSLPYYNQANAQANAISYFPIDNNNIWANDTGSLTINALTYTEFITNPAFGFSLLYEYF